jgi:dinuclear metal center YbgI/SA1388 family protein
MKKVKDITEAIEKFAPKNLKEDFDNVGLMVGDEEKEVKKVLLALDCTLEIIEEAKANNVDLIITHHPLIFRKPSNITTDTLLGKKIIELIKNDISLYSSHTNLDSAENGLNETIVELLGFENGQLLEENKNSREDKEEGLGRLVTLDNEIHINDLIGSIKEKLKIKSVKAVIGKEEVSKIAIINGSGSDFFNKAYNRGADCIITGDTTYHYASDYKEMGVSIIDTGHFASEWIVFQKVLSRIQRNFNDVEVIISNKSEDPYSFF